MRFTEDMVRGMGGEEPACATSRSRSSRLGARENFELYDDVLPALARSATTALRLGLVSNTSRDLDEFVRHFRLDVDAWISSRTHGKVKPSPTIFKAILEELEVEPPAAVMVGDSAEDDIEGARALGMDAYLVDRGGGAGPDALPTLLALPAPSESERTLPSRAALRLVPRSVEESFERPVRGLMWSLGLGAFGLAWSITTVAAYLPPLLSEFTESRTLIGLVLAAEGLFAFFMPLFVGPLSDATQLPLGRRRPFMLLALAPMAVCLSLLPFMPGFQATALALFGFFFAYYIYEPPYRGLYPDLVPDAYFGRAQGVQHVLRGLALGAALVGGGFLLSVWQPFPFVLAAGVTLVSCGAVVVLVHEVRVAPPQYERFRSILAAPWRVVRRERNVRRFLIANTAWEATFAGIRTFVVLYIIDGLGQPLYISSTVLGVVAAGYVVAALAAGRLGDEFGIGNVILGASVVYGFGLLVAGFAQTWHWWYYGLIAPVAVAGGRS